MVTNLPRRLHSALVLDPHAGTAFIMWLGEQITERGIGNGMSLLIFTGIVVGLPKGIAELYDKVQTNAWGAFTPVAVAILVAGMIAVVAFIVTSSALKRRIPVQYAKRIVGRRMMGGQSTHLPLKVNSGGVMRHLRQLDSVGAAAFAGMSFFGSAPLRERPSLGQSSATLLPANRGTSCFTSQRSSSSPTSTSRSSFARMTSLTTCASTAVSSRHPPRQAYGRFHQ